jgi:hypothetical protein
MLIVAYLVERRAVRSSAIFFMPPLHLRRHGGNFKPSFVIAPWSRTCGLFPKTTRSILLLVSSWVFRVARAHRLGLRSVLALRVLGAHV